MIERKFHNKYYFFILLLGDYMKLLNIIIPINPYTVAISSLLGVPGNFAIVLLKVFV